MWTARRSGVYPVQEGSRAESGYVHYRRKLSTPKLIQINEMDAFQVLDRNKNGYLPNTQLVFMF